MNRPLIIFVDLFCGAGGVTQGAVEARFGKHQPVKVIACVNHDPLAIESHEYNHRSTLHFSEDIRTLSLHPLVRLLNFYREKYPGAIIVLWASLECTNYSKAKGGLPRDADSRSLPNEMDRYVDALRPDYFYWENVEEFMSWGPLDENGKPVSKKNGRDWLAWQKRICKMGYRHEWRILNAADYGSHTKRKRLFGIFAKEDRSISWPDPTHSEFLDPNNMFGDKKPWNPVREVLDFEDEGTSIFTRKKPLVENTLKRIYAGLKKYVAKGDGFLMKYYSSGGQWDSLDKPCGALTTKDRFTKVQCVWLMNPQFNSKGGSVDDPCFTLIARMDKKPPALIQAMTGQEPPKVHKGDSPTMVLIKKFCQEYGIVDILTRMLKVPELKRIQGFPDDYYLAGNQTDQKKFIGNSVPPPIAKALMEALASDICITEKLVACP